jgi:hypothetical protein
MGWGGRQDTREQGHGGGRVAATVLPVSKDVPRAGVDQAEDLRAFARATRLDFGWLAAPRPGRRARAPRRERRCIAPQQQGLPLCGTAQSLGPRRGAPRLPLVFLQMSGDHGGFGKAQAPVLQQLGAGEDVVDAAEAVVNQLLEPGRTPAGAAAPRLDRPLVHEGGERGWRRRGAWGGALGASGAVPPEGPSNSPRRPMCCRSLRLHAEDHSDLRDTLAVHDREESEKIRDLAQVPQGLRRLQLVCHFCTIRGRHGKTHAAHRDVPPPMRLAPRWQACPRCVAARQSIFQKIFFLRSIARIIHQPKKPTNAGIVGARMMRKTAVSQGHHPPTNTRLRLGWHWTPRSHRRDQAPGVLAAPSG